MTLENWNKWKPVDTSVLVFYLRPYSYFFVYIRQNMYAVIALDEHENLRRDRTIL